MKKVPIIFLDIDGVLNTPHILHKNHKIYMHKHRFLFKKLDEIKARFGWEYIPQKIISKISALYDSSYTQDEYGHHFDDDAIANLEYIIDETGADIVISSTWRYSGFEQMKAMWQYRILPGKVVGITCLSWEVHDTTKINEHVFEEFWRRDEDRTVRGHEVKQYCIDHDVDNYVILDDDSDFLESQKERFVCTRGKHGLTRELAEKAVKILNDGKGTN